MLETFVMVRMHWERISYIPFLYEAAGYIGVVIK